MRRTVRQSQLGTVVQRGVVGGLSARGSVACSGGAVLRATDDKRKDTEREAWRRRMTGPGGPD
jgi:hypothetical protein